MDKEGIDIKKVISLISKRRDCFSSEADFQLEFAWILKELYQDCNVRLEFCPYYNSSIHYDILIIKDGKWIPIELKYKTRSFDYENEVECYSLKDQGARDQGCYDYLKDIMRIEEAREKLGGLFQEGYTVFLTNDLVYRDGPGRDNCYYNNFAISNERDLFGVIKWNGTPAKGTTKDRENPITLVGKYKMEWKPYADMDNGCGFYYLFNEIK